MQKSLAIALFIFLTPTLAVTVGGLFFLGAYLLPGLLTMGLTGLIGMMAITAAPFGALVGAILGLLWGIGKGEEAYASGGIDMGVSPSDEAAVKSKWGLIGFLGGLILGTIAAGAFGALSAIGLGASFLLFGAPLASLVTFTFADIVLPAIITGGCGAVFFTASGILLNAIVGDESNISYGSLGRIIDPPDDSRAKNETKSKNINLLNRFGVTRNTSGKNFASDKPEIKISPNSCP